MSEGLVLCPESRQPSVDFEELLFLFAPIRLLLQVKT